MSGPLHTDVAESLESSHRKKIEEKRDTSIDDRVKDYLRTNLHEEISDDISLHELLKDGTMLCKIVNTKYPNMIRGVKASKLPYVQMENISKFIKTLEKFGVPKGELFTTVDLFEEKDMQTVALSLDHLSRRWPTLEPSPTIAAESSQ